VTVKPLDEMNNARKTRRKYSVEEVVAMLEEEEDFVDAEIVITPPENQDVSDEDSGQEDETEISTLSGKQLNAEAEVRVNYGNRRFDSLMEFESEIPASSFFAQTDNVSFQDDQSTSHGIQGSFGTSVPPTNKFVDWQTRDLHQTLPNASPAPKRFFEPLTPCALFDLYFDDEVMQLLVDMTILYAKRDKGKHSFLIDVPEMRLFLAILLVSGYCILPRRRLYWQNLPDVYNKAVSEAMSRNRFEEILSVFHLCDNNRLVPDDKMAKVRSFYAAMNERCL